MKIEHFEAFVVGNPPPSYGGKYFVFVKLVTSCGIVGYGEIYSVPFHPHIVKKMFEDVCERMVVGHSPFDIEALWRRIYGSGYSLRPDVSMMGVISGIEIACWDIIGKATDKPVHALLGGKVHEKLRSYTYLYPREGENEDIYVKSHLAAERALEYADMGFTAVKFDPVGPYTVYDPRQLSLESLERSEAFVKDIREAVGTRCDLLFGTHGQMTPSAALRLAKRIEAYDPLWLEEPTGAEMPEEMAKIASQTTIPIATGERLTTKYEFARVMQHKAASIIQMAISRAGGLLEAKKIASIAEVHYCQIAPHLYCGPIEGAANIQLATCTPNFLILESIQRWEGFHTQILKKPITWENGYVIPPKEAGLGVELDEEVARAHPYEGKALHLNMLEHPL